MTTPDAGQRYKFKHGYTALDWREFIHNCTTGDNYFRGSEYLKLIEDLQAAADEIERLRGVERERDELAALVKEHGL